jgi:hypothetical protein
MLRLVAATFVVCALIFAQTHPEHKKSEPASMPVPQPAPEMEKLTKALVGSWIIQEKIFPGPMAPQGGTGKGSETIRKGPGGFSLLMDYQGNAMGPFTGHGVTTWAPEKKMYETAWVDSMTPGGVTKMTGTWEGESLVLTGTDTSMGKPMEMRHTYSNLTPKTFTYTMEMGEPGGKLEKVMELQYRRVNVGADRKLKPEPSSAHKN